MECECTGTLTDTDTSLEKDETAEEIKTECTTFDFGSVNFGTKATKMFEIKNDTDDDIVYTVTRDPASNPIYQSFHFHYKETVPKNSTFKCIIYYKPLLAPWWNVDTLNIEDITGKRYKLILKGNCLGALVQISTNHLKYFVNDKNPIASKTIEVKNVGTIPAKFRFDVKNNAIGYFKIDITQGVLEVGKYIYVTIVFEPKKHGIYSNDLYLLTLHTKPKIIKLVGYYTHTKVNQDKITFKTYNIPLSCKTGFNGYLYDVLEACETPPTFSLTSTSLDFGSVDAQDERTLVTSLTNNISQSSIKVIWDDDINGFFEISPKTTSIPPNNSILLECTFKPNEPDMFYDAIMTGRVFWNDEKDGTNIAVPLCIYLRLLGSTFPIHNTWFPQLSYPDKVLVRPALPNSVVHDSFEMKITGHLPVSYRLVPPKNSKFILKPNQGVILNHEFIIIQFSADNLNDTSCVEKWSLILNGREKECHFIFISTYVEIPKLLVNTDNMIRFDNVFPGCKDKKLVTLKNISVHYLKFRLFVENENTLQFSSSEGHIVANEEITLECTATALTEGVYRSNVKVELRKFAVKAVVGPPFAMIVQTKIRCVYAELCAIPNVINLETVRVDQRETSEFELFNFGESVICCTLMICPDDDDRLKNLMKFIPEQSEVAPGKHKRIVIAVKCSEGGYFEFYVCYKIRLYRDSLETLPTDPKNLIRILLKTEYPILQVIGIGDYTHGECFSKAALWKLMNINKLNHELRMIQKGENRTVKMFLPDSEVSDDKFSTSLVLQNQSIFDLKVSFKRNKICDCPKISVDKSISFRENTYDCRHRRMFEAQLSSNHFKADDTHDLKLTIKYEQPEEITMSYYLQLSEQRTLVLYFYFNILEPDVDFPSRYSPGNTINLPPVALFETDPPCLALHFYNQTSNTVKVGLNENQRDDSRYDRGFEVMKCLNPDVIDMTPYKSYALLFQFLPIECTKYTCLFNLILGSEVQKLQISSMGTLRTSTNQNCDNMYPTKADILGPDISYSTDYVTVVRLLTWSCTEVIVFIKNNTEDIIGYSMKKSCLEGVMSLTALNYKGVLKPKETRAIIVHVDTFDVPLKINRQLIGKFLNHTEYFRHKKSQFEYNITQELVKEEFTITKKGEVHEANNLVVIPMPRNFFRSIMFELTNISIFDVDLHMDVEEQLKQSPQYILELNEDRILQSLIPRKLEVEHPVPTLAKQLHRPGASGDNNKNENNNSPTPLANSKLLKDTIECMLLTALESKLFRRSLELQLQNDPPYYIQFQVDDEIHYKTVETNKIAVVRDELKICQGPDVATIFRNLLSDGLHHVMQLGPPPGHRNDRDYIYDKKFKSQYTS